MSDIILRVDKLGKKYRLGQNFEGGRGLRHVLNDFVTKTLQAVLGEKSGDWRFSFGILGLARFVV